MKYLLTFILAAIVGCTTPTGPDAPLFPEPEPLSLTIIGDIDTVWIAIECQKDTIVRYANSMIWREDLVIYGDTSWNSTLNPDEWTYAWCGYVGGIWLRGDGTLTIPNDTLYIGG